MRLKNFDSVFAPVAGDTEAPAPQPEPQDAERDLSDDAVGVPTPAVAPVCEPPSMTEAQFKSKFSGQEPIVVTLSMGSGQTISCHLVDNKALLSSSSNTRVLGAATQNSRPLFLYAGGSWISDSAKVGFSYLVFFIPKFDLKQLFVILDFKFQYLLVSRQRTICRNQPMRTKQLSSRFMVLMSWIPSFELFITFFLLKLS